MKKFLINGLKSTLTLSCASLAFVAILIILTLIGAFSKNFPLTQFISDDLYLLLILAAVNLPLGFFLGSITVKLRPKRIFYLSFLGFLLYWLLLILIIVAFSESGHALNLYSRIIGLSLKALLAYSFYAAPLILIAVFVLEKKTRK